ncbi:MAG: hypothetical protein EHM50_06960 [Lysobacterales bacterium]|nr:MAG: hypothetical protein EHM50_06960 [Xanthomonadales bacterium]
MSVAGGNVRSKLEYALLAQGFDSVDKVYLVYYVGDGDGCGRGAWPPTLHGNVAAVYIGAAAGCTSQPFATAGNPPGFLEFMGVHEVLHALGIAATCAPHHTESGHVGDSVQDVMYSGPQTWAPATLDVNHDDYFGHGIVGCRDLANSALLEPLPAGAEAPPGWPYVDLTDLGCTVQHTPGTLGVDTEIMFVNKYLFNGTESTAQIYEVVPNPAAPGTYMREFIRNVAYNDGIMLPDRFLARVQENAVFVVLVNNNCHRTVRTTANPSRFIIE